MKPRKPSGHGDFPLGLFPAISGGDRTPAQAARLEFVRRSVAAKEPGDGRMIELLRSLLEEPAEALQTS
jgi:hypothetical protein